MNLSSFNGKYQFVIIKELCELSLFADNEDENKFRSTLLARYYKFAVSRFFAEKFEEIGWKKTGHALDDINIMLTSASSEVQYNAIGLIAQQTTILIAKEVYMPHLFTRIKQRTENKLVMRMPN